MNKPNKPIIDIGSVGIGSLSTEELELSEISKKAGGENHLTKDQFIRLIALRYMRLNHFSEQDATECVTLQWEVLEKGIDAVSQDVSNRLREFYSRPKDDIE